MKSSYKFLLNVVNEQRKLFHSIVDRIVKQMSYNLRISNIFCFLKAVMFWSVDDDDVNNVT